MWVYEKHYFACSHLDKLSCFSSLLPLSLCAPQGLRCAQPRWLTEWAKKSTLKLIHKVLMRTYRWTAGCNHSQMGKPMLVCIPFDAWKQNAYLIYQSGTYVHIDRAWNIWRDQRNRGGWWRWHPLSHPGTVMHLTIQHWRSDSLFFEAYMNW